MGAIFFIKIGQTILSIIGQLLDNFGQIIFSKLVTCRATGVYYLSKMDKMDKPAGQLDKTLYIGFVLVLSGASEQKIGLLIIPFLGKDVEALFIKFYQPRTHRVLNPPFCRLF